MNIFYDTNYALGNIPIVQADRRPCPVCGHPTGDCTGESPKPDHIAGFSPDEESKDKQMFLVDSDVVEERQLSPFFTAKVIVHHKGKLIPYREAEKLGLV
jgi:hypothetical protein